MPLLDDIRAGFEYVKRALSLVQAQVNARVPLSSANIANGYVQLSNATLIPATVMPAFTGDITSSAGSLNLTLATVNSNVGVFGNAIAAPIITVNSKGLITAVSTTPILSSVSWANVTSKPSTLSGFGITDALNLAGGTLTGFVTLHADPTNDFHPATKRYVDAIAQGLDPKGSVLAATTTNITLSGLQIIDGVSVTVGSRVLVKNQSTASQNGIYVVASGAWTRASDMDVWAEFPSSFVFVEEGGQADTGWTCVANAGGTLGTTAVNWVQFSGQGTYTASTGVILSGNDFQLTGQALSLHNLSSTGFIRRNGVNSFSASAISNSDLPTSGVVAGNYRFVTVNDRGIVTAGSNPDITIANVTNLQTTLDAKADLVGGKIPVAQLPAAAITDVFVVSSQAAMLALNAQRGDVAKRTDVNKTFILSTDSPTTLIDWVELAASGGAAGSGSDTFIADGVGTEYTLSFFSVPDTIFVAVNGILQRQTTDYTVVGNVLTFPDPLPNGAVIIVRALGVFQANGDTLEQAFADLGYGKAFIETFLANGVQNNFLITNTIVNQNHTLVSINGLLQDPEDYSISGQNLSFTNTVSNASTITVRYSGSYYVDDVTPQWFFS